MSTEELLWPADVIAAAYPYHVYIDHTNRQLGEMKEWCHRYALGWNNFRVDEKILFMFLDEGIAVRFALKWV